MSCPQCGKECASEARFCSACGASIGTVGTRGPAAGNFVSGASLQERIVRPRSTRWLAGVCAGFAMHYGWDLAVTRILFTILTLFTFPVGVLFYIAAWLMLPDAMYALPSQTAQPMR